MRKHGARAAKAYGDLVHHQVHVIAAAQRARQAQVVGVVHGHARSTLHQRFNNECGGGGVVLLQPGLQRGGGAPGHVLRGFARGCIARIGAGHGIGQTHQRGIGLAEDRNVGHSECAHGLAVVAAGQAYKAAFGRAACVAPVVRAHLERDLGGGCAVAAVERMAQAGEGGQALGQLHHGRVGKARQHHVVELAQLVHQRGLDVWVAVAEQVDPPGADAVQVALPIGAVEPRALGARNGHGRLGFVPLHLGAGVPDAGEAAGHESVVRGLHGQTPWVGTAWRSSVWRLCSSTKTN
ncbi:hypothetical protein D3C71_1200260 [compost metagenome]